MLPLLHRAPRESKAAVGSKLTVVNADVGGEKQASEQRVSHVRFKVGLVKYPTGPQGLPPGATSQD